MNKLKLEIINEDNDIIAINKPAGLLTIPDRYNSMLPSIFSLLKKKYDEVYVVHRLDAGTSGVLLFAKNANAHNNLNTQFSEHTIEKYYTAVITGNMNKDMIEIDIPLLTNPNKSGGVIPSARGKKCLTIVKVIERFYNATLIQAELKTGRLHQLRAHCAAVGHPLIVDNLYGNNNEFYLSTIKRRYNLQKNKEEKAIISRPTLHSTEISFIHPTNNEKIKITADFPKDFAALIQILRKYGKAPNSPILL